MRKKSTKKLVLAGCVLATALVAGAVAAASFGIADQAKDPAEQAKIDQAVAYLDEAAIIGSDEWAEQYPDQYASWKANEENKELVDTLVEYPYLSTLYAGNAFAKDYKGARGHNYTLIDPAETGRKPAKSSCLSCKTPQMSALIQSGDTSMYTIAFADALALMVEPVSCYNCHGNDVTELVVTNTFLTDALGEDASLVPLADQVCGQCHNEYYFAGPDKATTLPYDSLESMTPEAILAFYNEIGFVDYTNPTTNVTFIKVQHPEFETYLGEGSPMALLGYTCADCHMGTVEKDNGDEYSSHTLLSPLDNPVLVENDCSNCHKDLSAEVAEIQEQAEARTNAIGQKLAQLTTDLAAALEAGTVSDEDYAAIAKLQRDAMFYWDFVFVENSEGAHNSALTAECLDKAEELVDAAIELLKK